MPVFAGAQDRSGGRAQNWEWAISGLYQESKRIGSEGGSTLDVDSGIGIGVNISYNFSNRLALGADLDFLRPDYRAVLIDDQDPGNEIVIDHEFSQFNARFKGTFNIIDGPFTPYVEAGLGWTYLDSNVADGPPVTGCWWHPFWGYICDNFYNTFSETAFTYGAGLGLRYQFVGGSFLKASYNVWELDGVGSTSDAGIGAARIEFGWQF
jgi:opacity protein-like surface antigen